MTSPNAVARAQAAHLAAEVSERTGAPLEVAMRLVTARTPADQQTAEASVGMSLNEALTYEPEQTPSTGELGAWLPEWDRRFDEFLNNNRQAYGDNDNKENR